MDILNYSIDNNETFETFYRIGYNLTTFFLNLDFKWSGIELIAIFFSILYVLLAAKRNIWCWGAAVISVCLYIYICYSAKLFAETGLQIFYLIMAFYGYINWKTDNGRLEIREWKVGKHFFIILLGIVCTFMMGFYFSVYTSAAMPITDSFTTTFSILATYMVVKKILENWLYWIVVDIVSIYLYFNRELYLTALLFLIYSIIAIYGYFSWVKQNKLNA